MCLPGPTSTSPSAIVRLNVATGVSVEARENMDVWLDIAQPLFGIGGHSFGRGVSEGSHNAKT